MKQKNYFNDARRSRWLPTLVMLLAMFAGGVSPAWAEEITVYDGTGTNKYIPLYGYYTDTQGGISEFIIPSSQLTDLNGKTIEQMVFYLSSPAAASFGAASFNVYLEEVTGSNYDDSSASQLTEGKTLVYAGALDATGSTMEIPFSSNYTYNGGNLLVAIEVGTKGTYKDATFYGTTTSNNTGRYNYGSSSGRVKFIPKTTFITPTNGPALTVKDGTSKINTGYSYSFGLATAGTTHTFTLSNPGTAAVEGLAVTYKFGATLSATTIAAGGEVTLTITMPDASASEAITISSTTTGIDDFVINVSGTIKDPSKIWCDFTGGLPTGWTNSGSWTIATSGADGTTSGGGYAYNTSSYGTNKLMYTPLVTIADGEKLYLQIKGHGTTASWNKLNIQYSADGTNWTNAKVLESITNTWQSLEVSEIPAGNWYIGFYGSYVYFTDIYGGTESTAPVIALSQASYDFGLISANSTSSDITITNTGKSALTGLDITSDNENFTVAVADNATTIAENGGTATFTVTMAPNATGSQSATITVKSSNADDLVFTATGAVAKPGTTTAVFNDATYAGWTASGSNLSYNSTETAAYFYYGTTNYLTSPKVSIAADDFLAVDAKLTQSYGYVTVQGSVDGTSWTDIKKLDSSVLNETDYTTAIVSGISTDYKYLRLNGYYCYVKQVAGLNYAAVLVVKDAEEATKTTGLTYAFGEVGANKSVSYTFSNAGAGTINITNIESSNAVFTTNFDSENKPAVTSAVPFTLTITANYDAESAGEQNGAITVTTSEGNFVINLTSTFLAANAPTLTVDNTLNFGKLTANDTQTVTVTNSGTGSMTVNIASDNELFTVSPAQLTEIGAGASKTFDVTFHYDEVAGSYGNKAANITVTPTYDAEAAVVIAATAKAKDPEEWSQDFSGNALPDGWTVSGNTEKWTFADGVAKTSYSTTKGYLETPLLTVATSDVLSFQAKSTYNGSVTIKVYKKVGSADWETSAFKTISLTSSDNGVWKDYTIEGLEAGNYKFKFENEDYELDNFEGFKLNANDPTLAVYSDAEATLAVTSGTAKDFGWVANTADATAFTSTYYIKNVGTGTLTITGITTEGCTATTAGDAMTVAANAADPLALTITMDKAVEGVKSGIVTLTTDGGNFEIPVKGFVYGNKNYIDFTADGAAFPAGWSTGSWTISEGAAISTSSSTIETKSFTVAPIEKLYIDINGNSGYGTKELSYSYSTDNGENWSDAVTLASASGYGTVAAQIFTISDIADVTDERTVQIRFTGQNLGIKHIYGFTAVLAPNLSTTAADINFGMQTAESAEQSFTITNDGTATLEGLSVTLGKTNAGDYSITSMKIGSEDFSGTELLAGQTITVTVKQNYDINNLGAKSDVLTIAATGQTSVTINLTGKTRDGSKQYIDFAAGIPDGWTTTGGWTASSGYVYTSAENTLRMLPITIAANEKLSVDARLTYSTGGSLKARYTTNNGVEWTEIAIPAVYNYSDFTTYEIDLGNTDNAVTAFIEFVGTSAAIDNIYGGVATTAPLINITEGGTVVANGATKDFGTVTKELIYETASYVIANDGTAALTVKYPDVTGNFSAGVTLGEGVSNDSEGNYVIEPTKSITFTVNPTFNPPYGEQNGTMTVKSGNGDDIITVNLKASFVDPTALYIDFADNKKPAGWYNGSWTFSNSYAQAPSTAADLITEMFDVTDDKKVLTFDVWSTSNSEFYEPTLTVYTSSDNRKTWTEAKVVEIAYNETTAKSVTLDALTAGTPVYVKFVGKYVAVDNIAGLSKIITEPEHDLYVVEAEQPDGIVVPGISYTATVNVASLRAAETVAAELWFKNTSDEETKVAELTAQDIALDATKEFVLTGYVPTTEGEYKVYTKVYNGDVSVLTEETDVTLQHTRTLAIQSFARFQDTNEPNVLEADANNQISPSFKVTVKNTGTTALTPIIKVKQSETVVGTATGTELAADATSDEITVTATNMSAGEGGELSFTAEAYWSSEDGATAFTFETPVTITVKAAAPKFELAEGSTALNDGDAVAFGLTKSTVVKTYTISNTGNNTLEVSAISAPEGFEAAYAEKNRDDAEWMLYLYKSDDVKDDVATFKQTGVANQFYVENVEITSNYAGGTNFCVRNSDWSTKYGWKDGNTVTETGKAFELATAEGATGWMTLAAGTYNVIFDASNLTITFQPQTTKAIFAGESRDVNVTLKAEQGKVSGNLAFTYKVDATNNATFTLALSGRSVAADTWTEDFATGIPASWENKGWTVEEGVAYSGGYETVQTLMTPRLAATNGEELTFDATFRYTGYTLTVEYSTDKTTWNSVATINDENAGEQTFTAPAAGNYYLRFTGTRYAQLDNFVGFTLNIPEHDTEIAAASIPTTGTQYGTYTATVTLKENAGKAEKVTATLYVNDVEKAAETETITANGSTVVTVTWKPDAVITEAVEAYIQVTADGIDLATDKVNLTIAAPFTLSDTEAPTFAEATTTYEALVLNREFVEGWNTVCLPFAITDIEEFFGDGAKAYTLNSYVAAENTLKFESATTMNASYPYVVYVPAAIASGKVVENVEIGSQYDTPSTTATYFVGTYAPIDDMSGKWGIGTAKDGKAKIMKGSTGAKMKGFRAYFALPGNTQGAPTMMFDEEVITGISAIEMAAEEGERIYNLNGQRVMNPKKGQMYIVNGKKVAIK